MKIYCAYPISGRSINEADKYYKNIKAELKSYGYKVFCPITHNFESNEDKLIFFNPYCHSTAMNHTIKERDKWMVMNADIVYVDLSVATSPSIGCIAELAWGDILQKHTILVMDEKGIHRHTFMLEMADIVFETSKEAKNYLKKLIRSTI